jgi:phytoene synthase
MSDPSATNTDSSSAREGRTSLFGEPSQATARGGPAGGYRRATRFESTWHHAGPEDLAFCRELLRTGSRTFDAASRVLPSRIRQPAAALYAFCRIADDAVDVGGEHPDVAIAGLRERLDAAYAHAPMDHPVDRAFADVVAAFGIPRELPLALLEGFAWDGAGRRYQTLADLQAYGARVAGTVGAMMAVLMGARASHVLARACDLGVAMQLTNIARDVGEDARMGRLYLPLDWLREEGVDPDAFLANPVFTPALGRVIARLIDAAEPLYARAADGIAVLPPGCRPGMDAARRLYAEIGAEVARRGYDSVSMRAVVPATRKSRLLLAALGASFDPTRRVPAPHEAPPPLPAVRHLVDAVVAAPSPDVVGERGFADGVVWMLVLFERLERREHGPRRP